MKLKLTGRHFEITDAMREHAEKRTHKFKHYFENLSEIELVMEKEHTIFKATATFDVDKKRFHIETKDHDLYESIDKLMDKVERGIRKHKEKISSHHKRESISKASERVEGEISL